MQKIIKQQITISRWTGCEEVSSENWKDLIASLVLCGYEIHGDDNKIVFQLGDGDIYQEVEGDDLPDS